MNLSSTIKSMEEELSAVTKTVSTSVAKVLYSFVHVFEEPKGLPPFRQYDHLINLKKEAQPICLGPYKYRVL